jgi:hypothetical protein
MSPRNAIVLLLALSTLLFLAGCGSNGTSPANPTAPPTGKFSNSNLSGNYVFSVSGTDSNGAPYAIAGTFSANGSGGNNKGGITGGTLDINDANTNEFNGPLIGESINNNGFYTVGVDGRGELTIGTNIGNGFPNLTFDFVLSSSSHGLITEFDSFGTASGTLDLQSSSATPAGAYAFSFAGATYSGAPFATAGNFTLGTGGAITGLADFNNGALTVSQNETLGGTVAVSSPPTTVLSTSQYPSLAFDVFPIDATHLKFIETDTTATLSGDAFSQTSTSISAGTMAFTLAGETLSGAPLAAGGFMVTDGNGNITNASTEDYNVGGTLSPATPVPFTAIYAAGGTGRYTLSNFGAFVPAGLSFAAYPSSGGLLLLEIDNLGITTGAAYSQASGATFVNPQGYALNLAGDNLANSTETEVDDIAEFAAASGGTLTGIIDENSISTGPVFGIALSNGTYGAIDSQGRYGLAATAANNSTSTLNGGFSLTFYAVDGTTFPFIESDSGQVATGVIVLQNPSASSSALAHPQTVTVRSLVHPHGARRKKN